MDKTIKDIISKECQKNGMMRHDADILGSQAETVFENLKNSDGKSLLDSDFVKALNVKQIEPQFDRLAELAFTKFLKDNDANLTHFSDEGPDIFIKSIGNAELNAWGEYKNIRQGEKQIVSKEDFKTRLTNALDKKFLKLYKDIQKGIVKPNQPIILFFSYPLLLDSSIEILKQNRKEIGDVPPIEIECLIGEKFNKTQTAEILPRYFIDDKKEIWDDDTKQNVLVDLTIISAVVFSECITNSIFEDVIEDYHWDNDLIFVHNPNAKNPIPEKLLPTWFEFRIKESKVLGGTLCKIQELH